MNTKPVPGLLLFCRTGYEKDCAAEIQAYANQYSISGYCKTKTDSGYVNFCTNDLSSAQSLYSLVEFSQLMFARQWLISYEHLVDLPLTDRATPLLESFKRLDKMTESTFGNLIVQQANSDSENNLQKFIRSFSNSLRPIMQQSDILDKPCRDIAHNMAQLCFISNSEAYTGYLPKGIDWPGGIPRLRIPDSAPSRSYLKLEEAMVRFIGTSRNEMLTPGMQATDLGAAPGGWSWLLIQNHLKVIAVDNGPLNKQLLDSGLCEHVTQDAFQYTPRQSCDWMVCDIVDKPLRVLELIEKWIVNQWCKRTIFNLKLPMQKRYAFVQQALLPWIKKLQDSGHIRQWQAKHLYHDRHEITVLIE